MITQTSFFFLKKNVKGFSYLFFQTDTTKFRKNVRREGPFFILVGAASEQFVLEEVHKERGKVWHS